jgi:hypothetical protein
LLTPSLRPDHEPAPAEARLLAGALARGILVLDEKRKTFTSEGFRSFCSAISIKARKTRF